MPGKILGIDISHDSIAAVQVVSSLKGCQIIACAHAPIDGDEGQDRALEKILGQTDLSSEICHTSIPAEQVSYRNLQLPFKDAKKIRQILPFEVEPLVPFSIEDLIVDFSLIHRSNKSQVLAASVEKRLISEHLDRLSRHGLEPDILDIRGVPTVLWLLKQERTPENGLFLQIDGKTNTMILFLEKRIVLIRSFPFNGSADKGPFPANEKDDDALNHIKQACDFDFNLFCTLVQNTIHGFGAQHHIKDLPEKILFMGSQGGYSETALVLNRFFNIPAEPIDLSKNDRVHMDAEIARAWDPALMDNAFALALREARQDQGFNFRKDGFEKKKKYFGSKKEFRTATIFFVILLLFLFVDMGADYYFLKKQNNALDQKIAEIFNDTFPGKAIPPRQELKFLKSEIDKAKASPSSLFMDVNQGFLDLLKDISQRIPQTQTVRIARMVVDSETTRISGTTDTFNTVEKIKNNLESSAYYSTATIISAKLDREGKQVEFEIKLERTES